MRIIVTLVGRSRNPIKHRRGSRREIGQSFDRERDERDDDEDEDNRIEPAARPRVGVLDNTFEAHRAILYAPVTRLSVRERGVSPSSRRRRKWSSCRSAMTKLDARVKQGTTMSAGSQVGP